MTPYYADDWLTVYLGDCRTVMAELPAASVHCVVTSPPYWGKTVLIDLNGEYLEQVMERNRVVTLGLGA